jgi:LysM repeat protein
MITASLRQHVSKRRSRTPVTRFKLIVRGRVRGVWEKKAERATLVTHQDAPGKISLPAAWLRLLKTKRWLMLALLGLGGLAVLMTLFLCFSGEPWGPLPLPAENGFLANPLQNPPEDEEAAPLPGELTLKKLTLTAYKVQARDTLEAIAKRSNLDLDTIISFNGVKDARAVIRGMVLTLPNHRGLRYRVRSGDSLSRLSQRFDVSIDDLLDWNNLSRSVITVGQGLFIPGGRLGKNELSQVMGTFFTWPVRGRLTSGFGMRISPITGTRMHHNGIDLANNPMTPVHAAASGRVAIVDYNPSYGNFIIIVHGNGFQTLYGHLRAAYVKKGAQVVQGQKIAAMGSTGASTGTHLHFSIFKNGRDVDPLKYLR